MKRNLAFFLLLLIAAAPSLFAQNTVGVLSFDGTQAFPGYNLIYPIGQSNVYLLDNCGRVVHTWADSAGYGPGNSVYLMDNGDMIKCKRSLSVAGDPIWAGGGGEFVEKYDWDGNLLWKMGINNSQQRLHHDIQPMDNGNVLMIVWDLKDSMDCVNAGRNPAILSEGEIWSDMIIEVEPVGTDSFNIVWQWDSWDHLIQDYDSTKDNYGQIIQHPELIDLNYDGTGSGEADWLHFNALDYNKELDQIAISSPEFAEIWIIDHSTTSA